MKRDLPPSADVERAAATEPSTPALGFKRAWNTFFFAERDPRLASVIRIGYAALLLVNVLCWAPDLQLWFGEAGLLPARHAAAIVDEDAWTLLAWLPHTPAVLWSCYALLLAHAVLLLVGWQTRIQAVCVFLWLTSFQHRNIAILDGEDTVFRLFAFYLALCPAGWAFSVDALRRRRKGLADSPPIPWALRLFQIQISVIYLSSAIEKSFGADWIGGKALYYLARLDDTFGKWPMPAFPFESMGMIKLMTWGTLLLEFALPLFLWLPRTRRGALVVGILFHLAIDYAMNLFLFHWIMILGLLSFAEFGELRWPARAQRAVAARASRAGA